VVSYHLQFEYSPQALTGVFLIGWCQAIFHTSKRCWWSNAYIWLGSGKTIHLSL
jgi:hypothetical protein